MALPMVHLLAADRWARAAGLYADSPEFFLGAISPDAMHIRYRDDKSMKDAYHLGNWVFPHPDRVQAYWDGRSEPFDVGYGIHCLTDSRWVPRYRDRLPGLLLPTGKVNIQLYYRETDSADWALLRENPRLREILGMLPRAEAPRDHPLLSREELDAWRAHILSAYSEEPKALETPRYVTGDYIEEFLMDCTAWLLRAARRFEA